MRTHSIRAYIALMLSCGMVHLARADDLIDRWSHTDAATQSFVLRLARRGFDTYARQRATIAPPANLPPLLRERCGVFVSTMRGGAPRTCMGTLYPTQPNAALELLALAATSAGRDKRFAPVQPSELKKLVLLVTFVGPPRAISEGEAQVSQPAREALAARFGSHFGVVLPGETDASTNMMRWARIRAGARVGQRVDWFRLKAFRLVERRDSLPLKPIEDTGES